MNLLLIVKVEKLQLKIDSLYFNTPLLLFIAKKSILLFNHVLTLMFISIAK